MSDFVLPILTAIKPLSCKVRHLPHAICRQCGSRSVYVPAQSDLGVILSSDRSMYTSFLKISGQYISLYVDLELHCPQLGYHQAG